MKARAYTLLLILTVLLICFGVFYKPYVDSNKIDDFGIAQMGSSLFGISIFTLIAYIGLLRLTKYRMVDMLIFGLFFITMDSIGLLFDTTSSQVTTFGLLIGLFLAIIILFIVDRKLLFREFNSLRDN